jgi:hypothetical protein
VWSGKVQQVGYRSGETFAIQLNAEGVPLRATRRISSREHQQFASISRGDSVLIWIKPSPRRADVGEFWQVEHKGETIYAYADASRALTREKVFRRVAIIVLGFFAALLIVVPGGAARRSRTR